MSTIALHHEVFGEDTGVHPPVVLVHGGAGTIDTNWRETIEFLRGDRLLVGVELQGHGHTPHSSRAYTFDNSAADIAALLADLGIARADVMSFSNGGPTVLALARSRPDVVRRIVVASGFSRRDGMIDGFWGGFDHPDIAQMPAPLAQAYRAINPDPADFERMFFLDIDLMRGFGDWDDADMAAIAAPALFVSGDRDVVRADHTVAMAGAVADGRALVVPAGHGDYLGMAGAGDLDPAFVRSCLTVVRRFLDEAD